MTLGWHTPLNNHRLDFPTSHQHSQQQTLCMADFDGASQVFLAWLKQSGAEISPKIQLQDLRHAQAGRGVGKWPSFDFKHHIPPHHLLLPL
jgi:hypothetical protein